LGRQCPNLVKENNRRKGQKTNELMTKEREGKGPESKQKESKGKTGADKRKRVAKKGRERLQ